MQITEQLVYEHINEQLLHSVVFFWLLFPIQELNKNYTDQTAFSHT